MALVSRGTFVRVILADNTGEKVTKPYEVNPAALADLAALDAAYPGGVLDDVLNQIAAVTNATVVGLVLGEEFREDTVIYGLGDKDAQATVTADIDGIVGKTANMVIPAPADGIFIGDAAPGPDAERIDATDVDLLNYVGLFRATYAAGPPATGVFLLSDGEQLSDTAVPKGYKTKP